MSTERCRNCRFWHLSLRPGETDQGEAIDPGFGFCRRDPPKIIDHMARMAIPQPGFGGHNIDPENVAHPANINCATLHPVTFGTDWCGRYEALSSCGPPRPAA